MKKIFFVAVAIAGLSNVASAQEAVVSAKRAPVENPQATKTRAESANKAALARETQPTPGTASSTRYRKAGATQEQSLLIAESMSALDKQKAELEGNTALTPDQKQESLAAIEAERTAVLKKRLGEAAYKKYTEQKQAEKKKTKSMRTN